MNNCIVTGGAGFIGSNLTKSLLQKGNRVTVVDNFSQGRYENLEECRGNKNLRIIKEDILNTKRMLSLTKNTDIIFHLAVECLRVSFKNPLLVEKVNSGGTLSLLWAAHKNKIKKFVYCSSSEVYGSATTTPMGENHPLKPTTVYGASKLSGEIYTTCFNDNFGLKSIIVRPFNTYGYNEHIEGLYGEVIPRFIVYAKNNLPLTIYGDGNQTRDFTFVDDTVEGIIKASKQNNLYGQAVNIARGQEITINQLANLIVKLTKSKSKILHLPRRPNDVKKHFADISKAKKILKYKPKISIEQGIELYLKYLDQTQIDFKKTSNDLPKKNW